MTHASRFGDLVVMVILLLTGVIYKRWSDDVAWTVCRTAASPMFGDEWTPLPVRPDSFRVSGWGTLRDIEAVYRWRGSRGYVGCTMLWDARFGWTPHELVAGPSR
jgi:hypothetical protein